MTALAVFLALFVSATPAWCQPPSDEVPPSTESDKGTANDVTSNATAPGEGADELLPPPPPPKPPAGLLPVAELTRLEYTPRDRPKALLYGTHLLVVGRSGFVEGHDAATGEFQWKIGLPGEELFAPLVFDAGPLVEGVTDAFTVVLSEPSGHVLLVDGLTGEIRQEARLPFELALPPIRGPEDIVFFATPSGDILSYDVRKEEVVFQTATGEVPLALASTDSLLIVSGGDQHLSALDLPAGTLRWTFRGRAAFHAPAAFDAGGTRVYAGDDTGEIYSLDAATGNVKFRWSTGAAIRSRMLIEGKRLYASTWANTLFAFNASTGDEHWRTNLPGRPATRPIRVGNRLIVGTYDGVLIEIDPTRGQPGKRYVAPGELVFAPSFFLARPSAEDLLAEAETVDVEPASSFDYEEEDPLTKLDPDIFGPEEPGTAEPTELEPLETESLAEAAPATPLELPADPAWFERSRIAMALRSGEVLLLAHHVPEPVAPIGTESDGLLPADGEGGIGPDGATPRRPPTPPSN